MRIGHIIDQRYIDHINDEWNIFCTNISNLFYPYEDKNILKFPKVNELIPLLFEDDTINFYINTHPDYTRNPCRVFKRDIKVKDFDPEVLKLMGDRMVRNLQTTSSDNGISFKHIIELMDLEETIIKEIRIDETTC